jgi:amino acid transporter
VEFSWSNDPLSYRIAQCISMAAITAAAARAADDFSESEGISNKGLIGIIIGLYFITLFSNLCGVKVGEIFNI